MGASSEFLAGTSSVDVRGVRLKCAFDGGALEDLCLAGLHVCITYSGICC